MNSVIAFIFSEFPLEMTVLALVLGFLSMFFKCKQSKDEVFLGLLFFFALGLSGFWGFIMHAFFPAVMASHMGWQTSPFQFSLAVADLGMGVVGIFGLKASRPYRVAGVLFSTFFLWGIAFGGIVQMVKASDFDFSSAGFVFYNDLILPALLIFFLLISRCSRCCCEKS